MVLLLSLFPACLKSNYAITFFEASWEKKPQMSFRGKIHIMTIKSDVYIPFQAQIKDYFNCLKILRKKLPKKTPRRWEAGGIIYRRRRADFWCFSILDHSQLKRPKRQREKKRAPFCVDKVFILGVIYSALGLGSSGGGNLSYFKVVFN